MKLKKNIEIWNKTFILVLPFDFFSFFCRQTPECKVFYIVSDVDDVLKSGYSRSTSGRNIVEWFPDETINLEKR